MFGPVEISEGKYDAAEIARDAERSERHRLNEAVFQEHMRRARDDYRGKVVVVAGRELAAFDGPEEAWAWAHAQHPEDDTPLVQYILKEKGLKLYGSAWRLVRM